MLTTWGCHDEASAPQPELSLLESDSIALCHISQSFETEPTDYPHPWSVSERSTWDGSITLDTIVDETTEQAFLVVSALTLYIPQPSNPMDSWLKELRHLRTFHLYACTDATFVPDFIPIGVDTLKVDKINPNESGYIKVPSKRWDTADDMDDYRWAYSKIAVHGLDISYINISVYYDALIDLSNNLLNKEVDIIYSYFINKADLSHNKYTGLSGGWNFWMFEDRNIPNLQYNEIPIPEEILATDFWSKNHELFIGNPGYQAPK